MEEVGYIINKSDVSKIAELTEKEVGSTEENVKQKIIVPLLEILGHKRQDLEFEYKTSNGGRIDIFIKNVSSDCKVLIETKNYNEDLSGYVEQIKGYTFSESSLISILANGSEFRIYSPLRGVAFERSLLYSIKRRNLVDESVIQILENLLGYDNLKNKKALEHIISREEEIKRVMTEEDKINSDHEETIEGIDEEIESKKDKIKELNGDVNILENEKKELKEKNEATIGKLWERIGLPKTPYGLQRILAPTGIDSSGEMQSKARKVSLKEAVDNGILRDKQVLYFFHGKIFENEQAEVDYRENKLRYLIDKRLYSVSSLALKIDKKVGLKKDDHGVAGPKYWKTEDGILLNDINEEIRKILENN
ncbi:MAG: type I restriction enzyme HsdR N-terminal domain-containing protein [Ferroplasma sp.]